MEFSDFIAINVYNPPNLLLSRVILDSVALQVSHKKSIYFGDFNGQHPLWGSDIANNNGVILHDFISHHNFVIVNDGSPTRLRLSGHNRSVPDVVFASPELAARIEWTILHEYVGMSDHFPILCNLSNGYDGVSGPRFSTNRFNVKKANWEVYSRSFGELEESGSIQDYDGFQQGILSSAERAIPKFKASKRVGNTWWDEECKICDFHKEEGNEGVY